MGRALAGGLAVALVVMVGGACSSSTAHSTTASSPPTAAAATVTTASGGGPAQALPPRTSISPTTLPPAPSENVNAWSINGGQVVSIDAIRLSGTGANGGRAMDVTTDLTEPQAGVLSAAARSGQALAVGFYRLPPAGPPPVLLVSYPSCNVTAFTTSPTNPSGAARATITAGLNCK